MNDIDSIFTSESLWSSTLFVVPIEITHMVDSIDGNPWKK